MSHNFDFLFTCFFIHICVEESQQEKERHAIQVEKMNEELSRTQSDLAAVEQSFKELRIRYEEQKVLNEVLRKVPRHTFFLPLIR